MGIQYDAHGILFSVAWLNTPLLLLMMTGLMASNVAENFIRKGVDFVKKIYFLFMCEQYCVINTMLLVKYVLHIYA
jgi:hypothetical protein